MLRAFSLFLSTLTVSAALLFVLGTPSDAQTHSGGRGSARSRLMAGVSPPSYFTCAINGPDRPCGGGSGLTYSATFTPPTAGLTYSWSLSTTSFGACPGTGTTSPSFCGPTNQPTVCVLTGNDGGRFVLKLVATNGYSESTCCLSVNVTPSTTASALAPASVCPGGTHQFCTTASGTGPFGYVWEKDGVVIPGATNSCYTATAGASGTSAMYCVAVTGSGACGTTFWTCAPLSSLLEASSTPINSAVVCEGTTYQFCTTASGSGPFIYSWGKNGVTIPGATASCYTATAATGSTVDTYCVTVTGPCGPAAPRCATLTPNPNVAATSLSSATVCEGTTSQFCTTASGTGPFGYGWTKNGTAIPGATAGCYTATAGTGSTVDTYCVTVTGGCGPAVQRCATLTSNPNVAATALNSATVCEGTTSQFCTTASGTGPFGYSWTKNGTTIPGATGSCYTATAGTGSTVDTYCVTVTGGCGPAVQRCATLTSNPNVAATSLSSATVCEGTTNQFCTTASGTGPFGYSWTKNGAAIPGATGSCYTATAGAGSTVDTYCVTVTGGCGPAVQRCATLTSNPNVAATALTSATVCEGLTNQFCTTASGTGPFGYSWTKNGAAIPGATGSCYTATAGAGSAVDTYCVTVTGGCGPAVQRCATLTSNPNVAATALVSATVCEGTTNPFCTTASGTGPFGYSWTKNGVAIPGATDSCYTATAGAGSTVDTYCVTVTGGCGPAVQRCATLTANPNVAATALVSATVCEGTTNPFCTTASGTGPFGYSWTKNGVAIPGATDSCYTATAGAGSTVDTYCVTVTGGCGPAVQRCATLTSNPNVAATALVSATVCEGTTNPFCTTASGTGPFGYSWTKNGVAIPGATDSCYTATAGAGSTVDTYCVTVTGGCGPAVQRCATLTANPNVAATALVSATVCEGTTNPFCTTASGTGPFGYSWTKNGSAIPGATDSCYTATAGVGGSVDTYCVTVTGACGPPVQRCATLTANPNVTATALSPATICSGATNQFCTTAGGTGPFGYSWTQNGVAIPGATGSCYTATAGAGGSVATYCVTVTGACGPAVQRCATLTSQALTTATQPSNAVVCTGVVVQLCTTAGGTGPFTYSWTKNGVLIPGATSSCYTATAGPPMSLDTYCVTVTGTCGSATQCALVRAVANTAATPLVDGSACPGGTYQFCTSVGGVGPFSFSWTRNGVTIVGATSNCYTATVVGMTVQTYCVTVSSLCGPDVTRCGTLTRNTPTTTTPIGNFSQCQGLTATLCTTPSGTGPFTYSWTKNGVTIPGATMNCYTATAPNAFAPPDLYCVTVTGACNSVSQCGTLDGIECSGLFITLDQSQFGDAAGQFNGLSTPDLVENLLVGDVPVGEVGVKSMTLPGSTGCGDCVVDLLPTTGTMDILPDFGDVALDPSQCQTSPTPIPTVNGELESLLIGQTVTLSLNVKLNEGCPGAGGCTTANADLAGMGLSRTMVSRTLLAGPDGCMGTLDDVPELLGPDLDPNTPDNLVTITIPDAVILELNELTSTGVITQGQTIGGLVELANLALAGGSTGTATLQEISSAIDSVSILYKGGRETVFCSNP